MLSVAPFGICEFHRKKTDVDNVLRKPLVVCHYGPLVLFVNKS